MNAEIPVQIRFFSFKECYQLIKIFLCLIFFKEKSLIDAGNLVAAFKTWKPENWFLPYGPILFSLWGTSIIPEAEEMIIDKKHLLRKLIVFSLLTAIFVYLFFIVLVLGITGSGTTEAALSGLGRAVDGSVIYLVFLLGLLAVFNAFISAGLTLKKVFLYDLKTRRLVAWSATCLVPLLLFFLGVKSFIPLISFIGGVMLGIDGILILLMYHKINRQNVLVYPLIMIFVAGIIYEISRFIS